MYSLCNVTFVKGPFCSSTEQIRYWESADFMGNDLDFSIQPTVELCMDLCIANGVCQAFTYDTLNRFPTVNCWLKSQVSNINMNYDGLSSGMRCSLTPSIEPPTPPDAKYPLEGKLKIFERI